MTYSSPPQPSETELEPQPVSQDILYLERNENFSASGLAAPMRAVVVPPNLAAWRASGGPEAQGPFPERTALPDLNFAEDSALGSDLTRLPTSSGFIALKTSLVKDTTFPLINGLNFHVQWDPLYQVTSLMSVDPSFSVPALSLSNTTFEKTRRCTNCTARQSRTQRRLGRLSSKETFVETPRKSSTTFIP